MRRGLGAVLLCFASACSSGPSEAAVVSRAAEDALVPAIGAAAAELEVLSAAATELCQAHGTASHEAAMEAWRRAESAWERSELTTFIGPANMLRTQSKVDYAPISEPGIDELLASDTVIDVDYVDNRAASTQRGLGAIEYGLFRDLDGATDQRVCHLVTSSALVAEEETRALSDAWTTSFDGGEPWIDTYTVTIPSNQALGDLVAAIVETLKRQSLFELGKALGISAPEPDVMAIPEGAAGEAAAMYIAQLEGIRDTLNAGESESFGSLIRARSTEVADRIDETLDRAINDLSVLDGPLRTMADEQPELLGPIYEDIAELRTLFESDVVSLLDITLGFSDTDGDTG